jgi:glutamyl/glutaminyl-tRNA synthetase
VARRRGGAIVWPGWRTRSAARELALPTSAADIRWKRRGLGSRQSATSQRELVPATGSSSSRLPTRPRQRSLRPAGWFPYPPAVPLEVALPPGPFTTRFAPAPTGYLHLGHVANAVFVWGLAGAGGGRVLLRIEDHDRSRCRPEYETALLDDLDWLGLAPDDGGTAALRRGPHPRRQSDHPERYAAALRTLATRGLVYPCACSRNDQLRAGATVGEDGELRYPGTCRPTVAATSPADAPAPVAGRAEPGEGAVLARRVLLTPQTVGFEDLLLGPISQRPAEQCGDLLARDRLGQWTYQFAVTVDDLADGVDLVIRGRDLLASTGRQIQLAALLGRTAPPRFLHHPLLLRADGSKLSKSNRDTGIRELAAAGMTPAQVLGQAAHLAGLLPAPRPLAVDELPSLFRRLPDPA